MSSTAIRVVTGPANYFSHSGSLSRLSEFYSEEQLNHAVWIYGERAWQRRSRFYQRLLLCLGRNIFCSGVTVVKAMFSVWLTRPVTASW